MSSSDDEHESQGLLNCWDWPVWCIVLMAIAGILLLAGIVLTGLNGRVFANMKKYGMLVGHNPPPSARPTAPVKARRSARKSVQPRKK